MVLSACAIIEKDHRVEPPPVPRFSDPLRLSYEKRLQLLERGNLVVNPSFEDGQSSSESFEHAGRIDGWQIVGRNVDWVDGRSAPMGAKEVGSGRRSVKIVRKKANETDTAEGVLSEYIRVLPGNYHFSYFVRLENVKSNKSRLGVQLYDAITINAFFFDENRQPIEPDRTDPVRGTLLDNSNKSYSFSNYWSIGSFPWARVTARTYHYPFSEGDIPQRARYVRLFLGLKGSGTMWIDDVVFRYTKWNFTALERMQPYFDKPMPPEAGLIPTPKQIRKLGQVVFADTAMPPSDTTAIVLPQDPAPAEVSAAGILREKIKAVFNKMYPRNTAMHGGVRIFDQKVSLKDIQKAKLVFSIGANRIFAHVQPPLNLTGLQGKAQGYVIHPEKIGDTQIVFLFGQTPVANYYAAATAVQLIESDRPVYHNIKVLDYPDFLRRAYLFKDWKNRRELQNDLDAIGLLSSCKLNKVYLGFRRTGKNWYRPDDLYRRGIEEAGALCRKSGVMQMAMMVNPYAHLGFESNAAKLDDQSRHLWTHGSPDSLEMLKDVYRPALDAGATAIMLRADDFVPYIGRSRAYYDLHTAEDRNRFVNLANAQAHVINQLNQWLENDYPGTRLEFCPPWYSNEHIDWSDGRAEQYFRDLTGRIPEDVAVIWTGPTIRSLSIDMADLFRYRSHIGRWPMLWDNTLYARGHEGPRYGGYPAHYPAKVRLCNLLEPYDVRLPEGFQFYNHGRRMYTNAAAYREFYKIKYATVADYQWNTAAYNPELSLWKALVKAYDPLVARQLLYFNDAYYGGYEMILKLKFEGKKAETIKAAEKRFAEMQSCIDTISSAFPGRTKLLNELRYFQNRQKKRLVAIGVEP